MAWFGTDAIGRDLYSRLIYGVRSSLFIGIASAISAVIIGTIVGAFAGFRGGKFDDILMRVTDLFLAFPFLVALVSSCGSCSATLALGRPPIIGELNVDPLPDHPVRHSSAGWASPGSCAARCWR